MHILVLGGGGREHAIIKALKESKKVTAISCSPGNPGIGLLARTYLSDPVDKRAVVDLAKRIKPDLVIVGPEAPLAAGVTDALRQNGFLVFGPSQTAAQLETSKVFSKNFLIRHSIPTAKARVCANKDEAIAAKTEFGIPCVVKVEGLASGKGVYICNSESEFEKAINDIFESKAFGNAGERILVEEFLVGEEVSCTLLVSGEKYSLLPFTKDHKRLKENDEGPNTGGMGAFTPVKLKPEIIKKIENSVIKPTIAGLKKDYVDYVGILYIGLMISKDDPKVLEFNVRFGDPEAQVILPLLKGDWAQVFMDAAQGKVGPLKWNPLSGICVVMAAFGYPGPPRRGQKIAFDPKYNHSKGAYILHAGTATHRGYVTAGGRVLNVVGIDKSFTIARRKAYEVVNTVYFPEAQVRKDIGGPPLEFKPVETRPEKIISKKSKKSSSKEKPKAKNKKKRTK